MSEHGFSINSCRVKIRDGTLLLEQCFSPLGFASCLVSHTSLIPLSESHEQQMPLYACCRAAWFITSASYPKHDDTSASSRADGLRRTKLLRGIAARGNQELPALVAPLSAAGTKGHQRLTFPAAQELLSAAK